MASGEPVYAIWAQSKEMPDIARPDTVPKSWLMTTWFGTIQQIQLKYETAAKR